MCKGEDDDGGQLQAGKHEAVHLDDYWCSLAPTLTCWRSLVSKSQNVYLNSAGCEKPSKMMWIASHLEKKLAMYTQ